MDFATTARRVVAGGKILGLAPKEKLPTYNVFYEGRTFSRGVPGAISRCSDGVPFGDLVFSSTSACSRPRSARISGAPKDRSGAAPTPAPSWSATSPPRRSGWGSSQTRRELIATRAADYQCTFAYANLVGANDGLIFDGGGYVNQNGKWMLEAPRFEEGFAAATVDLDRTARLRARTPPGASTARNMLVRARAATTIDVPSAEFRHGSEPRSADLPGAAHGSFFLPEPGMPGDQRARNSARTFWTRSPLGHRRLLREEPAPSNRSASRSPAGGTRC